MNATAAIKLRWQQPPSMTVSQAFSIQECISLCRPPTHWLSERSPVASLKRHHLLLIYILPCYIHGRDSPSVSKRIVLAVSKCTTQTSRLHHNFDDELKSFFSYRLSFASSYTTTSLPQVSLSGPIHGMSVTTNFRKCRHQDKRLTHATA